MNQYKYYIQQGNQYTLKPSRTTPIIIGVTGLILLYVAFFVIDGSNSAGRWGFFLLALLLIAATFISLKSKFIIDTQAKTLTTKPSATFPQTVIPFSNFDGFIVHKSTYGITLTASAAVTAIRNGKRREYLMMSTVLSARPLQRMIDETTEIMNLKDQTCSTISKTTVQK